MHVSRPVLPARQIIDLGGNTVGTEGLEPLKTALCANTTLHTVCLASCRMGEEGGVAMAEVIDGNAQLQRLDLRRNDLGVAGLMAIRLSMKTNQVALLMLLLVVL